MSQIITPIALIGAALAIVHNSSDGDEVSADLQYGGLAKKPSDRMNESLPMDKSQIPSWAVGARMNIKELGVNQKKNLVGKNLIQKIDKVQPYNFFEERELDRYTYSDVHLGKAAKGSEVLPSVVEPQMLGSGPPGSKIYVNQRVALHDPRISENKKLQKELDALPHEDMPQPLPAFGPHQPTHVGGGAKRGELQLQNPSMYPFKKPNASNFFANDGGGRPMGQGAPAAAKKKPAKPEKPDVKSDRRGFFSKLFW